MVVETLLGRQGQLRGLEERMGTSREEGERVAGEEEARGLPCLGRSGSLSQNWRSSCTHHRARRSPFHWGSGRPVALHSLFLKIYTQWWSNNRKANIFVHFTWFLLILLTALEVRENSPALGQSNRTTSLLSAFTCPFAKSHLVST